MLIYLVTFFISYLCLFLIERTNAKKYRKIFIFLAILFPCLLAGFRNLTIGTDVKVYAKPLYNLAINSNNFFVFLKGEFYEGWRYLSVKDFEIGFSTLTYLTAKLGNSFVVTLFFIQFSVIFPILKALQRYGVKKAASIGCLVYLFMGYNASLNMMRQWISMAIIVYAFTYVFDRDDKTAFKWMMIAFLFHSSTIIAIPIYFLYKQISKRNIGKQKHSDYFDFMIVALIGLSILVGLSVIIKVLSILGLSKYIAYINGSISILPNQFIIRLPLILLYFTNYKKWKNVDLKAKFYVSLLILDLFISQLASISKFSIRITSFFTAFYILSIPSLYRLHRGNWKGHVTRIVILIYIFIYWYYFYVLRGVHATIPYLFG